MDSDNTNKDMKQTWEVCLQFFAADQCLLFEWLIDTVCSTLSHYSKT